MLELLYKLEDRLNKSSSPFSGLDAIVVPVGSAVEGTRVGVTNEADCMVFFR